MKDLSGHIEYLLLENDKVILPHFGILSCVNVAPRYVEEENTFLPASRRLTFTQDFNVEDSQIEDCLVDLHRLSRSVASHIVQEYITSLHENLIAQGESDLGTIGQFVMRDGNINFEVCEAGITTQELYALDSFQIQPLPIFSVQTRKEKETIEEQYYVIRIPRKAVRHAMRIAAVILLAFLILVPGTRLNNEYEITERINAGVDSFYADMLNLKDEATIRLGEAFKKNEQQQAKPHTATVKAKKKAPKVQKESKPVPPQQPQEIIEEEQPEIAVEQPAETTDYCIVLASATPLKMAENYVKELSHEGIKDAHVLQTGSMVRVVISGFTTEQSALERARQLREEYYLDVWTMKTPR